MTIALLSPVKAEPLAVRFSNLCEGPVLRSSLWMEFGVRGMGVIPAGNKNEHAGHHHLLIDTPLPSDHFAQIPFSATHRHFGKGQNGTELDLPDGQHALRLALSAAPYDESCKARYQDQMTAPRHAANGPEAYVNNLRDDEPVNSPFVISCG